MVRNSREAELDRLIADVQFDRWIFGFPERFTIVSHQDWDHDPLRSSFKFPEPLIYSDNYTPKFKFGKEKFSSLYIRGGNSEVVNKVKITPLNPRTVSRLTGTVARWLHAYWWFLATKTFLVLFVGELDAPEIPVLARLLEKIPNLDAMLLVSYGGMNPPAHQVTYRDQMRVEVGELVERERIKGRVIYALPHPIVPEWAELTARRV